VIPPVQLELPGPALEEMWKNPGMRTYWEWSVRFAGENSRPGSKLLIMYILIMLSRYVPIYQCCGSCILIFTHPGSRIQKQQKKERGEKTFVIILFCSHKFHKIESYFIFEMLKKKIWDNFRRIIKVFTQKIFTGLSKIWDWDLRSGTNLFRIPDRYPQHWYRYLHEKYKERSVR
jgi:hypothetical protein